MVAHARLIGCAVLSAGALAGGLWLADAALQPIPMPLGGAAIFGWVGFWSSRRRAAWLGTLVGGGAGALLGMVMHVRSHVTEDRVESAASLAGHAAADLGLSIVGAALVLGASVGWVVAALGRTGPGAGGACAPQATTPES